MGMAGSDGVHEIIQRRQRFCARTLAEVLSFPEFMISGASLAYTPAKVEGIDMGSLMFFRVLHLSLRTLIR
jgi:hypothetical protein